MAASSITGARRATQRSWRPLTEKSSTFPVSQFRLFCFLGVDAVGLIAIRNTNSLPLDNATDNTTGMIGSCFAFHILDGIIVLRTKHFRCRKTASEFNSLSRQE